MAHALAHSAPLLPMLEIAAEEAQSVLLAASVSISQVELSRGTVRTIINVGELGPLEERWPDDEVYVIDEASRLGQAVHEMRTWTESLDDPDCDPYERDLLVRLGKGSSLATPILVGDDVWGELYLTRRLGDEAFDDESISYAEVLSAMLGAAVDRTLREAELEVAARRDPLTGLSNRRDLDEHVERMVRVEDGTSRVVTVVSIDINGLKQVNDSFGHARGDALIQWMGQALEAGFGDLPAACVARVGGDEFAVVVADHPVEDLVSRINDVCRSAWATEPFTGMSAGVASARLERGAGPRMPDLFAAADRAQYAAKRAASREAAVSHETCQWPGQPEG